MLKILIIFVAFFGSATASYKYFLDIEGKSSNKSNVNKYEGISHSSDTLGIASESVELTPTLTPTRVPTVFPSETNILSPSLTPVISTPKPTITLIPKTNYTSQKINEYIERFSGQYAVDPNVLRHIALCESGFNSDAVNGPYVGLYQYNSTTWSKYRTLMGENTDSDLRFDAEESTQTAAYMISIEKDFVWPNCNP